MKVNNPVNKHDDKNIYVTNKERIDRFEVARLEQLGIVLNQPDTAILLLRSAEETVILKVLHHLDKYLTKSKENTKFIYELGISKPLLEQNCFSSTLFVQRYALKIISEFMILDDAKKEFLKIKECFDIFFGHLMTTKDDYLLEYSTLVIAHMSDEPRILFQLYKNANFLKRFFSIISSTIDPDTKYNCFKILINVLQDPVGLDEISHRPDFNFEEIRICIKSAYPEIQLAALRILEILTIDEKYLNKYMEVIFVRSLYDILSNKNLVDLHEQVCAILKKLYCIDKYYDQYAIPEYLGKHMHYLNNNEINEKVFILGTIVAAMHHDSPKNKNTLEFYFNNGIVEVLLEMLPIKKSLDCCNGLKEICKYPDGILEVSKQNPIPILFNMIDESSIKPETKIAAAEVINIILSYDMNASCGLVIAASRIFIKMLSEPFGEISLNTLLALIKIMITMSENPEVRCRFMSPNMSDCMVNALQNSFLSTRLVIEYMNLLCIYLSCTTLQEKLLDSEISKILIQCLESLASSLKAKAADFIILSSRMSDFCEDYIENGILQYLLDNKDIAIYCSKCSTALESILSNDLSVKFSVRNYLTASDKIPNNFYASRNNWTDFLTLRHIMQRKEMLSPRHSIYFINFDDKSETESLTSIDTRFAMQMRLPDIITDLVESIPDDANKLEKIEILLNKLNQHFQGNEKENEHEISVHLNELKYALLSTVIPVEYLRKGGSFERALLFKILGEQIEIWSTIHLNQFGSSWNEITFEQNEYCKVTHVVDVFRPGKYYRIGSIDAREYIVQCSK